MNENRAAAAPSRNRKRRATRNGAATSQDGTRRPLHPSSFRLHPSSFILPLPPQSQSPEAKQIRQQRTLVALAANLTNATHLLKTLRLLRHAADRGENALDVLQAAPDARTPASPRPGCGRNRRPRRRPLRRSGPSQRRRCASKRRRPAAAAGPAGRRASQDGAKFRSRPFATPIAPSRPTRSSRTPGSTPASRRRRPGRRHPRRVAGSVAENERRQAGGGAFVEVHAVRGGQRVDQGQRLAEQGVDDARLARLDLPENQRLQRLGGEIQDGRRRGKPRADSSGKVKSPLYNWMA